MTIPLARLCALLILCLALMPMAGASQEADTSTRAVANAASRYVAQYQQSLTSILADESLEQEVVRRVPADPAARRLRSMLSEVFFMFTPGTNHWMAIRDVIAVDGSEVKDRPDIRRELATLDDDDVAAALKAQNSRFNIGRVTRNFSEPTLGLLVLDARHRDRFKFERRRVQNVEGVTLVTLAFTEKESPTLIWDLARGKVFSTGDIIVEAGSGRVRETTFRASTGDITVELTTRYVPDGRLEMWVPASFRESYEGGVKRKSLENGPDYEHVVARASYSNYRRFQTAVRIK
ncbi:MAG: hypothetical protein M3541_03640 [Acidobacteriota bacterium]|nr:hypothetical protein [Acidobacteriota bacterium]MDQ3417864.1 hypothetical protein [Acidobacteriota bacterium]